MATRNAAYAAQLFETDLGTILLASEGEHPGWHVSPDPETTAAFYEKLNRKTLGQILKAVKAHARLEKDVETIFQNALSARNRLNHGFYEKHNFAIYSAQGRDAMITELEALHNQLSDAWQVTRRISAFLVGRVLNRRGG